MDRCALFVDAGYLLADGAMAVHGTRQRDAVSWDYAQLLELLTKRAVERTQLPMLRCYWYEATTEGDRAQEHEALADLPGLKLRLGRVRPGRREGVDLMAYRDLTTLAREHAICDAVVVSGDEDMVHAVADAQDFGVRVTGMHVAVDGNWTISRTLRQECDDLVEIVDAQLRPYVNVLHGADSSSRPLSNGQAPEGPLSPHLQTPSIGGHRIHQAQPGHTGPQPMPSVSTERQHKQHKQDRQDKQAKPERQGRHHTTSHAKPEQHTGTPYAPQHGDTDETAGSYEKHPPPPPEPSQEPRPVQPPPGSHGQRPPSRSSRHRQPPEREQPPAPSQAPQPPQQSQQRAQSAQTSQPSQPAQPQPPQPSHPAQPPPPPSQQPQQPPRSHHEMQSPSAPTLSEAVQAAHSEGRSFGESVARDAPALWLEAVLARKPRMPSDLEARLLQGSALPIDFLLHDDVRHALRRGFWEALESSRRA